jgi:predicted SprT family Zn-dependent metalloprotease
MTTRPWHDSSMRKYYDCPDCRAKLLVTRIIRPKRGVERCHCPHCRGTLPPRDGAAMLMYNLASLP